MESSSSRWDGLGGPNWPSISENSRKRKNSGDEDQTATRLPTRSNPAGMLSFSLSEPGRGSVDVFVPTHHGHPFTDNAGLINHEVVYVDPRQLFPDIRHNPDLPIQVPVFGVEGMTGRPMPQVEAPVNTMGPPLPGHGLTKPDAAPPSCPPGAVDHGVSGITHVNRDVNQRGPRPCIRCLVRGRLCEGDVVCKRCNNAHLQRPHCIRRNLVTIANVSANGRFEFVNNCLEQLGLPETPSLAILGELRFDAGEPHMPLFLVLDRHGLGLEKTWIIPTGCLPLPQAMVNWSEQMIDVNNPGSFEVAIEKFVKSYSRPVRFALQEPNGELPLARLLDKVHTLKALYRICCCEDFKVEIEGVPDSQPLARIAKLELRSFARLKLEIVERDILAELDDSVASNQLDTSRMPALWAALWQLIFVYNHLLRREERRDQDATELLNGVAVFYSAVFRRKQDLDMRPKHLGGASSQELDQAFKHALNLRASFFDAIKNGNEAIHSSLNSLVEQEMGLMVTRRHKASQRISR